MQLFYKGVLFICVSISFLFASSLQSKYPSYSYVFNEFDVDESYAYNDEFVRFVKTHEKKLKGFYERSLRRGKEILPMMQGQLFDDGVSDLFIYLSMIESGFSTNIVSSKKAVGLWQFMPSTAKRYNLSVNGLYDERCDARSATTAAIKYLNKLHRQFGKWYLAAMAYNCGEGCVSRAIRRAGSNDIEILTDNHLKYLPKETRDYIRKILLIAMIGESSLIRIDEGIQVDSETIQVEVRGGTDIGYIAKLINIDKEVLLGMNHALIDKKVPKNKEFYTLTIPIEKIYAFYLRYDPNQSIQKTTKSHLIAYSVKLGDTLESIAKKYDSDVAEIRLANHLDHAYLKVGMLLVLPVSQKVFQKSKH